MKKNIVKGIVFGILITTTLVILMMIFSAYGIVLKVGNESLSSSPKWDVHLDTLSRSMKNEISLEKKYPSIQSSTTIGDYELIFKQPGNSASYTFNVVNAGTFGAKLSSITNSKYICTDKNGKTDSKDAINVCNNLIYDIKYTNNDKNVKINDTLLPNDRVNMTLTITYNFEAPKLNSEVRVSNLSTSLVYIQDDYVKKTNGK